MATFGNFTLPSPTPTAPSSSPSATPTRSSFGSFSFGAPDPQSATVADARSQAQVATANSRYANSFPGMAWNTAKGLWENSGIPEQFSGSLQMYRQNAPKWMGGTNPGGKGVVGAAEGALGVGAGVAGMITAPAAPLLGNTGPKDPIGLQQAITAIGNNPKIINNPKFQAFANSPHGQLTSRVLQDIVNASMAGGVAVGGLAGLRNFGKFELPTQGETEHPTAPETSPTETTPASPKPMTAAERHAAYARSQGYEPYTPKEELPTIQTGPKTESNLPTIQTEAPSARPARGEPVYEPIKETPPTARSTPTEQAPTAAPKLEVPFATEGTKGEGTTPAALRPAESLGETRASTLASKVDAKAVSDSLREGLGNLPEYNKTNWEEQGQFAADIVKNQPDRAINIAMGKEPPPPHVLTSAVFKAVEDYATRTGDGELSKALASKSSVSLASTRMGQEIGYLSQRDETSPVRIIKEVDEAKATRATPARRVAETKNLSSAIKASVPTTSDWAKFIEDIKCGY